MGLSRWNFVVLLAIALSVFQLWRHGQPKTGAAPALAFTDTHGKYRTLSAPDRPTAVVLWVSPCAYCDRSLGVLDEIRRLYKPEDLDVVGFYLNPVRDDELDQLAVREKHATLTMARGQPTPDFVEKLTDGFGFRGTGRDIYIVGRDGRYIAVDASDLSAPTYGILQQVRGLLINRFGLKERAG